jgi:hypothetical protein
MGAGTDGICVCIDGMRASFGRHDWFSELLAVVVAVYKGDLSETGVYEEA